MTRPGTGPGAGPGNEEPGNEPAGPTPGRLPPTVVAAVALAGLEALFCVLPGLSGLSYGLGGSIQAFVVGGLYLVLSAATVYGSVLLVRRRGHTVLQVVGYALVLVWLVNLVLSVVLLGVVDVLSVLLLALAVGLVVVVRRPEVRAHAA